MPTEAKDAIEYCLRGSLVATILTVIAIAAAVASQV
jgi:hypothetical protein